MQRWQGWAPVRAGCAAGCAGWLLFISTASAQTAQGPPPAEDAATSQARALFNEGTDRAHQGDWSQALAAFERSAALRAHAVTTYNIGYCERALGRYTRARKMLGKALAENVAHGGAELGDDMATAAKTYLAELEKQIARAVVSVSPDGTSLSVDGRPLERAPDDGPRPVFWAGTRELGPGEPAAASTFELQLDPGAHVFVVSKAGYSDNVTTRSFEPGSAVDLAFQLSPLPVASSAPTAGAPAGGNGEAATSPGARAGSRVPIFIAFGVGAAGLATGAIAGLVAMSWKTKVDGACSKTTGCTGNGSSYLSSADTAADVSTVGFVVGGVGAATGLVLWWLLPKGPAAPTMQPGALGAARVGSTAGVLRDVHVTPWLTPTGGGVLGTF